MTELHFAIKLFKWASLYTKVFGMCYSSSHNEAFSYKAHYFYSASVYLLQFVMYSVWSNKRDHR